MARPDLSRVAAPFHVYIKQVKDDDLLTALRNQASAFSAFLQAIPENKTCYRYAEGKWTIKEVLQHIIDAERVFAYRALCFARREEQSLPSFDENNYAEHSEAHRREWKDMLEEFSTVRKSTIQLFSSFSTAQLEHNGTSSNGKPNYTLAMGFIVAGHVAHHEKIMRERYL